MPAKAALRLISVRVLLLPVAVATLFSLLTSDASAQAHTNVQTVFLIVMENAHWSQIKGSASAPFINNTLLPVASYCAQYYTPPGFASSLPDYLWLEGGTNYGILDSAEPSAHVITSTNHLVTRLKNAGISWKTYQENITGSACPTSSSGLYAAYHNPFVYFTDIISNATYCVSHQRPYSELAGDLRSNTVARYNFITPNLCNDMHNSSGCATTDRIRNGDNWLALEVPKILNSQAYSNNGAIFITWDEGENQGRGPIGMIVLSPLAKGRGYSNTNFYTHSSMLRTVQEIFGLRPFLADAANAASLSDLFRPTIFLKSPVLQTNQHFQFTLTGVSPGKTNVLQASTNLATWVALSTYMFSTNTVTVSDPAASNFNRRYYRVFQTE